MNIDSFEQLITRIGRLRSERCGSIPTLTISVVYALTSSHDEEEIEAFYMILEKFYRADHTFFKVILGDFDAKFGPRRTCEERHIGTHGLEWNEQGERLSEFITATNTSGKEKKRLNSETEVPEPPQTETYSTHYSAVGKVPLPITSTRNRIGSFNMFTLAL
uniref:Uncharacterized protein n=1 Tax=Angiostrongylus cantonensis TaxID=6313 RepID=A0A0K0CWI4_ANGCA